MASDKNIKLDEGFEEVTDVSLDAGFEEIEVVPVKKKENTTSGTAKPLTSSNTESVSKLPNKNSFPDFTNLQIPGIQKPAIKKDTFLPLSESQKIAGKNLLGKGTTVVQQEKVKTETPATSAKKSAILKAVTGKDISYDEVVSLSNPENQNYTEILAAQKESPISDNTKANIPAVQLEQQQLSKEQSDFLANRQFKVNNPQANVRILQTKNPTELKDVADKALILDEQRMSESFNTDKPVSQRFSKPENDVPYKPFTDYLEVGELAAVSPMELYETREKESDRDKQFKYFKDRGADNIFNEYDNEQTAISYKQGELKKKYDNANNNLIQKYGEDWQQQQIPQDDRDFSDILSAQKGLQENYNLSRDLVKSDKYAEVNKTIEERAQRQAEIDKDAKDDTWYKFTDEANKINNVVQNTAYGLVNDIASLPRFINGLAGGNEFNWTDKVADATQRFTDAQMAYYNTPTDIQRDNVQDYAEVDGYRVFLDKKGNPTSLRDADNFMVNNEAKKEEIFKKYSENKDKIKVKTDWLDGEQILNQSSKIIGDMLVMVAEGGGIGAGIKGTGKLSRSTRLLNLAENTKLTTSLAVVSQMQNELMNDAIDKGMSKEDAAKYAAISSAGVAAISLINPMEAQFLKNIKNVKSLASEEVASFVNGSTTLSDLSKKTIGNIIGNAVPEIAEEQFFEPVLQNVVNDSYQSQVGVNQQLEQTDVLGRENLAQSVLTATTTFLPSVMSGANNSNSNAVKMNILENPDNWMAIIDKKKELGIIEDDVYSAEVAAMNKAKKKYDTLKSEVKQSDRIKLAGLIGDKVAIESKLSDAPELKPKYENQVKEIDSKIANLTNGIAETETPEIEQATAINIRTEDFGDENKSDAKIESAVIEINGKIYEGKNHAEAILKAKADGQDISNVNRQAEGKFRLTDGSIIDRAESKSRFGQDRSELMIPQDEAAKQANKDYAKITKSNEQTNQNVTQQQNDGDGTGMAGSEQKSEAIRAGNEQTELSNEKEVPVEQKQTELKPKLLEEDYNLNQDNTWKAEMDIAESLGLQGSKSYHILNSDTLLRIKSHTPNWSNFSEDLNDNPDIKKVVNITVGDYNNSDYRRNKTTLEEIEKEHPNIEFVDIQMQDGDSINATINELNREINKNNTGDKLVPNIDNQNQQENVITTEENQIQSDVFVPEKVKPQTLSQKDALSAEPTSARDEVMQFFISPSGGLNEDIIGTMWKNNKGELYKRRTLINNENKIRSIDEMADIMWQAHDSATNGNPKYSTDDYRNAIEEVLNDHSNKTSMIKEILSHDTRLADTYNEQLYWEQQNNQTADDGWKYVFGLDGDTDAFEAELESINTADVKEFEQYSELYDKFVNADGSINWDEALKYQNESKSNSETQQGATGKDSGDNIGSSQDSKSKEKPGKEKRLANRAFDDKKESDDNEKKLNKDKQRVADRFVKGNSNFEKIRQFVIDEGYDKGDYDSKQIFKDIDNLIEKVGTNNIEQLLDLPLSEPHRVVLQSKIFEHFGKQSTDENLSEEERKIAFEKSARYLLEYSRQRTEAGRGNAILNQIYLDSDIYFTIPMMMKKMDALGAVLSDTEMSEISKMSKEIEQLRKENKELQELAKYEEEQQIIEDIKTHLLVDELIISSQQKDDLDVQKAKTRLGKNFQKIAEKFGAIKMLEASEKSDFFEILHEMTKDLMTISKINAKKAVRSVIKSIKQQNSNIDDKLLDEAQQYILGQEKEETEIEDSKGNKITKGDLLELIEDGADTMDKMVEAIRERYHGGDKNVTDKQIRDDITNYGKSIKKDKTEVEKTLSEIKSLMLLQSKLEDAKQNIPPKKTGTIREKDTIAVIQLRRQLAEAMKKLTVNISENEIAGLNERKLTYLTNRIKEVQDVINGLNKEINKKAPFEYNKAVKQKQKELDDLMKQQDVLLHFTKEKLTNLIEKYQKKIDNKIYAKNPVLTKLSITDSEHQQLKKTLEAKKEQLKKDRDNFRNNDSDYLLKQMQNSVDKQIKRIDELLAGINKRKTSEQLKAERLRKQNIVDKNTDITALQKLKENQKALEAKKEQWEKEVIRKEIEAELANKSKLRRLAGSVVNNLISLSRTATLGLIDVGWFSVQGGYFMRTRPFAFGDALKKAYTNGDLDEKSFTEWRKNLKEIPLYEIMLKSGLRIPGQSLREEVFEQEYRESVFTNFLDKLPVAKLVNKNGRLSVKFLAHLRMDVFSDMYKKLSAEEKQDAKTLEKLADFVNVHSGAGGVVGENKNGGLHKGWSLLTSARNTSSMLQQTYLGMIYQAAKNYDHRKSLKDQSILFQQVKHDFINQLVLFSTLFLAQAIAKYADDDDEKTGDWEIEYSPFSTDFLKLKGNGKKYFDMGGTTSLNVATLRLGTMMLNVFGADIDNYKTKTGYGQIGGSNWNDKSGLDILGESTMNRIAPFLSFIKYPLMAKHDADGNYYMFGEEYTPNQFKLKILLDMIAPINAGSVASDITDEKQNAIQTIGNFLINATGVGVSQDSKNNSGSGRDSSRGSDSRGSTRGESSRGSNSRGTER